MEQDDPGSYDLEELIQIGRLQDDLHILLEQILSMDPNGMIRIELVLARVRQETVVEKQLH